MENSVLGSFKRSIGEEVVVGLKSGARRVVIRDVADGIVEAEEPGSGGAVPVALRFGVSDLGSRERLSRMDDDESAGAALVKALMALEATAYSHALKYAARTGPALSEQLSAKIREMGQ